MTETTAEKFEKWKIGELLQTYKGLELLPITDGSVQIAGTLSFSADKNGLEVISDSYEIFLTVPLSFPREIPLVKETTGRIPKDFHTMANGSLCLGSPSQQKLALRREPTLPGFVKLCVVPYLYGFAFREKHRFLPFGELKHGKQGLRQDFAEIFSVKDERVAMQMVRLAGMRKRIANKLQCPCGSRRRLGRCHNRRVNGVRTQLGRTWCRAQYQWIENPAGIQKP
ncbi:MAG: hypothetical protein JXB18_02940 [Sedimentisphaerales bacterium]|nr:hypothetical protein [Sedimentisphaerales bacterium]